MSERSGAKAEANAARNGASDEVVESAGAASAAVSAVESGGAVREAPVSAIEPDPAQPRRVFDEEKLRRLAREHPELRAAAGARGRADR